MPFHTVTDYKNNNFHIFPRHFVIICRWVLKYFLLPLPQFRDPVWFHQLLQTAEDPSASPEKCGWSLASFSLLSASTVFLRFQQLLHCLSLYNNCFFGFRMFLQPSVFRYFFPSVVCILPVSEVSVFDCYSRCFVHSQAKPRRLTLFSVSSCVTPLLREAPPMSAGCKSTVPKGDH